MVDIDSTLTAAIIVIGDEILSGRTHDTNVNYIAKRLVSCGIDLKEVRIIPDDESEIIDAVNTLRHKYTYVFTTGGIGYTHDDITASSIAKAFGRKSVVHLESEKMIQDFYGDRINDARLSMAMMPENVELILNPISGAPSFYIENVFVMAGMPSVMYGMFEFVVTRLKKGVVVLSNTLKSSVVEGMMAPELFNIQNKYKTVSIGSYPFYNPPNVGTSIVLKSRDNKALSNATKDVYFMLKKHNVEIDTDFDFPVELF